MIKLYSAESFRDYIESPEPEAWVGNGDVILLPESCEISAELNGAWQLTLVHPFDEDGRYEYIKKGCVIAVPARICREQTSVVQLFRIYEVRLKFNNIEAIGYPIAMDSIHECPINEKIFQYMDALHMIMDLEESGIINVNKYSIDVDAGFTDITSTYAENTNLQEFLNGDQEASFKNVFGAEIVYDNLTYRLRQSIGSGYDNAGQYLVAYGVNLSGVDITESVSEVITRIYPYSYEGYTRVEVPQDIKGIIDVIDGIGSGDGITGVIEGDSGSEEEEEEFKVYVDADGVYEDVDIHGNPVWKPIMEMYPIVYARSIRYDDVKMIDEADSTTTTMTEAQNKTAAIKEEIIKEVMDLSEKYLKMARKGEWEHETGMVTGYWYGTKDEDGYAKNYQKDNYLMINGTWYHFDKDGYYRSGDIIDTETKRYLDLFSWREDDTGWFFTDGNGNFFYNCWITSTDGTTHYWVGSDGYYQPEWDDVTPWEWYTETDKVYKNPHEPDTRYNETDDRFCLPYGYIFYSYTDAVGVLTEKALDFLNKEKQSDVYNFFADCIKRGMQTWEDTDIAEWDWRAKFIYEGDDAMYLDNFRWIQDSTGWFYGDGQGHYFTNAWIEDAVNKHYWVGPDGYYQPQWDDQTPWEWVKDKTGWWYGSKFDDGTTKNYAYHQFIFDTSSRNWCKFNPNGYFVEPDNKRWWYGTKNGDDYIFFKYWTIEDHIYWFDSNGYVDQDILYLDKYELRTDDNGTYYGDGKGHYVKNAWIEESSSKHYWAGDDGYIDETKTDENEWSWYGDWETGWQYGTTKEASEYDETSAAGTTYTETQQTLIDIDEILDMTGLDKDTLITKIEEKISGKTYRENSILDKILTYVQDAAEDHGITVETIITTISNYITGSGYDLSGVSDNNETNSGTNASSRTTTNSVTIPTTEEEEEEEDDDDDDDSGELVNYAKNQFLYITGNSTVYYFNEDGYMTAAWMADNNWEWLSDDRGWWYGDNEGTYPTGQWMKINGKWYFFNSNGYADESTDDFADSKTGGSNSASFDNNREGISTTSSTDAASDEAEYDENREGVKAWIQDGFVEELREFLRVEFYDLQTLLNDRLEQAALNDMQYSQYPNYTVEIDFEQLRGTQNYEQYSFLLDNFLGDYVTIQSSRHGILSLIKRIEALTYDCCSQRIKSLTIGSPMNFLAKQFLQLSKTGSLVTFQPTDALETGYYENSGEIYGDIDAIGDLAENGYYGNVTGSIDEIPDRDEVDTE